MSVWQFIAGGEEDRDFSPLMSAKREALGEANISEVEKYAVLETQCPRHPPNHEKDLVIITTDNL